MISTKNNTLFLNTLLFIGLFYTTIPIKVDAIPIQLIPIENIKYPIYIACECDYSLYVDDKYIEQANKEVNIIENWEEGHPGWNATKKFIPVITNETPKIIAFNGIGGEFSGFLNGFIMDFNNGKGYTKYKEWKCKDFSKTIDKMPPPNWFTFDYDDSEWSMAASFGENYQNNSFQLFERERDEISLQAEWLWTSDNSNKNIYCRKKNENVKTIPLVLTTVPVQTSAPHVVSTTIHTNPVQTSAPSGVSKTIHPSTIPVQTSAPHVVSKTIHPSTIPVQTSAPTVVSKTIHLNPVQTSAPTIVSKTIHPSTMPVQTSAPHVVSKTIHPSTMPVQTSTPTIVSKTIHPSTISVQTSAPTVVSKTIHPSTIPAQTSAPTIVSKTIHTNPVQTSAPTVVSTTIHTSTIPVQTSAPTVVSTTIHPSTIPVQTSAPTVVSTRIHTNPVQTSAPHVVSKTIHPNPVPTIVISPHIQIIIQNIKYSQRRSNAHIANLFLKLKLYNEEYRLHNQLMIARLHLRQHYNAIFYDIRHLLEKQRKRDLIPSNDKNDNKKSVMNIPRYIHSMHTLNACIKKIERSIQFIKGNHKYILLRILNKLKLQYQQDTEKLFMFR